MERLAAREGRTEDLAETALRLARVLRLDAIAVLDVPAPGDWLRPAHPVLAAGATAGPAAAPAGPPPRGEARRRPDAPVSRLTRRGKEG